MEATNSRIFKKMGILIAIALTAMQLVGYFFNLSIPTETKLLSFIVIPLRWIYLYRMSDVSKNLARCFLWLSWDLSMVSLPVLMFTDYSLNVFTTQTGVAFLYSPEDVSFCINAGSIALAICFFSSVWYKNEKRPDFDYFPNFTKSQVLVISIIVTGIILAGLTLSKFLGIGQLAQASLRLPMKLTGALTYVSQGFFCFFEIFLLDAMRKKGFSLLVPISLIFVISFYTAYVSLSKAALIVPAAVVLVYVVMVNRCSTFRVIILLFVVIFMFIASSFLSAYRDSKSTIYSRGFLHEGANYTFMMYVHRIFSEGNAFMKIHSVSDVNELRKAMTENEFSPRQVMTYLIDKTSVNSMHNSGCTTLAASYMLGYGYMFITVVFLSIASLIIDYVLPKLNGIFASTFFRVFIAFFFSAHLFPKLFWNIIFELKNGYSPDFIFYILNILCCIIYLKIFCEKKTQANP